MNQKINNIEKIKKFIINEKNESLLINQVNDDIGEFYFHVIKNFTEEKGVNLIKEIDDNNSDSNNLFVRKEIEIFYMTNVKNIEKLFKRKSQKIIISDYKNKKYLYNLRKVRFIPNHSIKIVNNYINYKNYPKNCDN